MLSPKVWVATFTLLHCAFETMDGSQYAPCSRYENDTPGIDNQNTSIDDSQHYLTPGSDDPTRGGLVKEAERGPADDGLGDAQPPPLPPGRVGTLCNVFL